MGNRKMVVGDVRRGGKYVAGREYKCGWRSYQTTRKLPPSGFVRAMRVLCGWRSRSRTRRREVVLRSHLPIVLSPPKMRSLWSVQRATGGTAARGAGARVMGFAGGWLCASRLALSYVRPSTRRVRRLPTPSRSPPAALPRPSLGAGHVTARVEPRGFHFERKIEKRRVPSLSNAIFEPLRFAPSDYPGSVLSFDAR